MDLNNKTALITGAAGLLGCEHCIALVKAGAKVIMSDISEKALRDSADRIEAETGCNPFILTMDVSDIESVKAASKQLLDNGFQVNRLVNNAAINPKVSSNGLAQNGSLESFRADIFHQEVSVGLTGAIHTSQVFGPLMAEMGDGVIINIASDLSVISPDHRLYNPDHKTGKINQWKPVSYSVIKTGLIGLTRYLATYWADRNVRSVAVSPGGVQVDQDLGFVDRLSELIPLKRMAQPNEYHELLRFLCSDGAAYLNGQNIVMDGGRSIL